MNVDRERWTSHPLHGLFVGGTLALFVGATLVDVAYARTYQIEWLDFGSWLVVGALVVGAVALLAALVDLVRRARRPRGVGYAVVLAVAWIVGLFDAFTHARDAWASMPGALVLSVVATALTVVAAWLGLARAGVRG